MRVLIPWLRELVAFPWTARELAEKLTQLGLELEGMEEEVLEIKVTANRGDCLSVLGVAREVAALAGAKLRAPEVPAAPEGALDVSVSLEDVEGCPRYSYAVLDHVAVKPSPDIVQQRLEQCGIRPHDAVVDATNYALLLFGQPLHAFDLDRSGSTILVRRAQEGEELTTLDGERRQLRSHNLVIATPSRAIALAGVMGGLDTEIRADTRRVLLESAHFDPKSVRETSRAHRLSTASSYRFERFVDPEGTLRACLYAAGCIEAWTGATLLGAGDEDRRGDKSKQTIAVRPRQVEERLGLSMPALDQAELLRRLGFSVTEGERLDVTVPSYRPDVTTPEDVAEEVARLHGYGHIPTAFPRGPLRPGQRSSDCRLVADFREAFLRLGFQEIVGHSLVSEADLGRAGGRAAEGVPVRNPLSLESSHLRPTLLLSLADAAERNLRQGVESLALFEIGHVFRRAQNSAGERLCAAAAAYGSLFEGGLDQEVRGASLRLGDMLGKLFQLSQLLNLRPPRPAAAAQKGEMQLKVEGRPVGRLAVVPLGQELKLGGGLVCFELDLEMFAALAAGRPLLYEPPSRFPRLNRDLALVGPRHFTVAEVEELIRRRAGPLLRELRLFDYYEGAPLPAAERSLGFRLSFQSPERTLREEEIEQSIKNVLTAAAEQGFRLRDR